MTSKKEVSFSIRAVDRATATIRKVTQKIERIVKPIEKVSRSFRNAERSVKRYTRALENTSRVISKVGKLATIGLTLPIAAIGTTAIKTSASFAHAMNKVKVLTKGKLFEPLENQARKLGATTMFAARQAADAMGFYALAGFESRQILATMPATVDLATASTKNLAETADVLSSVIKGYHIPMTEITTTTDMLTAAFSGAKQDLITLGESLEKVGGNFHKLGIPLSETLALIGKMRDLGIDPSSVGTALVSASARLIKQEKPVVKTLRLLNIDASKAVNPQGGLGSLVDLLDKMDRAGAKSRDYFEVFGIESGKYLNQISGMAREIRKFQRDIESSTGITRKFAKTFQSDAVGAMNAFKSAIEAVQISIGKSGLLDFFTEATFNITTYIQRLSEVNPAMIRLGTIALAMVAVVGPALLILAQAISGLALSLVGLKIASTVLAAFGSSIFLAIGSMVAAFTILTLKIAAVIYAGWFFVKNWKSITDVVGSLIDDMVLGFKRLWNYILSFRGYKKYGAQPFFIEDDLADYPSIKNQKDRFSSSDFGPVRSNPDLSFDIVSGPKLSKEQKASEGLSFVPDFIKGMFSTTYDAFSNPIFDLDEKKFEFKLDEEKLGRSIKLTPKVKVPKLFKPVLPFGPSEFFGPSYFKDRSRNNRNDWSEKIKPSQKILKEVSQHKLREKEVENIFSANDDRPAARLAEPNEITIVVDFKNLPRGVEVKTESQRKVPLKVNMGFAMEGAR